MTNSLKRLLMMNVSSSIIFNYMGIFINLFIWEKGQQIFDVAWFNLVMFVAWGIAFMYGAKLLSRFTIGSVMRVSAICAGATFILLSWVHVEPKLFYLTLIALPVGITNGFYSAAQNIGISLFGKGKEFTAFFSATNVFGQIIAFINPLLFALIIQGIGFTGSFLVMFVFIGLMIVASYYVPRISLKEASEPVFKMFGIGQVFSTPSLKWMIPSLIAGGFFIQFQGIFSLIFTFSVTKDKLSIALLQIMYTAFTVACVFVYRRLSRSHRIHDSWWLTFGMIAAAAGFLLALFPTPPILIVSNILTTVGLFFFFTIWSARQFIATNKLSPVHQARIMVWRELILVFSRIIMLALILGIANFQGFAFKAVMIFSFASALLIPYFSKKAKVEEDIAPVVHHSPGQVSTDIADH
ncbi:MFS transporter [Paenibacillus sp. N3.4]|uniref:MFS transporter n=1 Tax=Paenibacillus sp. N3.4 TaxID=2603222 RepID=UPI0011CB93F1|nr:MFS transporter [Paenibacillus sp. N3.4]TXK75928.1 MFS transporter [Paenibacillus sp. N3.4]